MTQPAPAAITVTTTNGPLNPATVTTSGTSPQLAAVVAPVAPATPATGEQGYPANTPVTEMTMEQQVAYWRHHSRQHEERAKSRADYDQIKARADQLAALEAASMSEHEKAVQSAKDAGRAEALREIGSRLVDAQVTVASAGRMTDAQRAALLEGIDRSKFLAADGQVDTAKVSALIDQIAPATGSGTGTTGTGAPAAQTFPALGQGARQGTPGTSVADGEALYRQLFPKSE